jgi:hypothetical protein
VPAARIAARRVSVAAPATSIVAAPLDIKPALP